MGTFRSDAALVLDAACGALGEEDRARFRAAVRLAAAGSDLAALPSLMLSARASRPVAAALDGVADRIGVPRGPWWVGPPSGSLAGSDAAAAVAAAARCGRGARPPEPWEHCDRRFVLSSLAAADTGAPWYWSSSRESGNAIGVAATMALRSSPRGRGIEGANSLRLPAALESYRALEAAAGIPVFLCSAVDLVSREEGQEWAALALGALPRTAAGMAAAWENFVGAAARLPPGRRLGPVMMAAAREAAREEEGVESSDAGQG